MGGVLQNWLSGQEEQKARGQEVRESRKLRWAAEQLGRPGAGTQWAGAGQPGPLLQPASAPKDTWSGKHCRPGAAAGARSRVLLRLEEACCASRLFSCLSLIIFGN